MNEKDDGFVSPHGPIYNPVDRFAHLPGPTRRWLESLTPEQIKKMEEMAKFYDATKTIGRFWKWLIITFVAAMLTVVQFGEAFSKILAWLFGKGRV